MEILSEYIVALVMAIFYVDNFSEMSFLKLLVNGVIHSLWIVALCIILLTVPTAEATAVATGSCGENLTWELDPKGVLTISGTGEFIAELVAKMLGTARNPYLIFAVLVTAPDDAQCIALLQDLSPHVMALL